MINFDIFLIKPITQDYESVISDIEETLSILSRNSRSNTPASEICFSSRTPTPSFGQINYFSMTDLIQKENKSISDKHIIPIVTVFDDLKDYLSDSDLSLDYRIARQRRKQKNMKNLSKSTYLSNPLTPQKKFGDTQKMAKLTRNKKPDDELKEREILPRSMTCPSISTFRPEQDFISCVNITPHVNSQNGQQKSSHKESLLKNKQENDCAVRKINNNTEVREVGGNPGESTRKENENVLSNVNISRIRACKSEGKFPNLMSSSSSSQVVDILPTRNVGTAHHHPQLGCSFSNIFQASSVSPAAMSSCPVNRAVSECSLRPSGGDQNYNKLNLTSNCSFSDLLNTKNDFSDVLVEKFRDDKCNSAIICNVSLTSTSHCRSAAGKIISGHFE